MPVEQYPIIPNPISFPDFTPIYGSWQEYKTVMYKFNDPAKRLHSDHPAGSSEGQLTQDTNRKVFNVAVFESMAYCWISVHFWYSQLILLIC